MTHAEEGGAERLALPRVVHRIWLGGPEPDWCRPFADTWRRPGWELRQWSGPEELYPLRNQDVYDRAREIAPDHVGQLRADVLRYEILARYGGVYVDADFECLRPIDALIGGAESFAAWELQERWIANGLMGAVPGHPFIERLIEALPRSVAARPGQRPARVTGPQFLTRMQRRHGGLDLILPQHLVYPYGWDEVAEHGPNEHWPDAWLVHHWSNQRRERGLPCPA
jgi:mannosyltransferase OCH1-like enzyme